jgi:menaquinone-dependent protoporphyrinogen oxidase
MSILVVYASKHGSTQQIAEHISNGLEAAGQPAEARPVMAADDLAGYDAFVIGGAVYYGSWLKEAAEFVRRHQTVLVSRPVWLFSSGPISAEITDEQGRDLRALAEPKESAEFQEAIHPRDHRVFFGRLDRGTLGFVDRLVASLPAFPGSEGDFRDWQEIGTWAERIAHELAPVPAARG